MNQKDQLWSKRGIACLLFAYTLLAFAMALSVMIAIVLGISENPSDMLGIMLGMLIGLTGLNGAMFMVLTRTVINAVASGKQDEASNSSERGT